LKEYMKDLSKVYYSSTEYLKLIFDWNICSEASLTQQTSTVLLNILKSKPAVLQPQSSNLSHHRGMSYQQEDKLGSQSNQKSVSFLSMQRSTRKENYAPRYA
jgi:hypothetical protein